MDVQNCATATNSLPVQEMFAAGNEIVAEARAGSSKAFAELYALYSRRLYKTIFAITKHPEDTEDALQETFMRACLAIHAFEGRSTVYSWLTRIAINSALLVLRKRRARGETCLDPLQEDQVETPVPEVKDLAPNPEQSYDLRQRRLILARAVRTLDSCLRGPVEMRIENDASLKEIGQRLKISEGAVKARLYRARVQLLAEVEGLGHARKQGGIKANRRFRGHRQQLRLRAATEARMSSVRAASTNPAPRNSMLLSPRVDGRSAGTQARGLWNHLTK